MAAAAVAQALLSALAEDDHQSCRKEWLEELKDAVYDAENLLDEINTESLRSKVEKDSQNVANKVRSFFSSSFLEDDKEKLMKMLLCDEDPKGNDIGVITIWGMGGLGKTTLAQLLYNDEKWKKGKQNHRDNSSEQYPELGAIGKQIARKCGGLPIAAKTIGGLLRSKVDAKKWNKILNSNQWDIPHDDVLPALHLSYIYLPSHLKKCFAYCSIFPKDMLLDKKKLVLLWMAEGFVHQQSHREKTFEMEADDYFNELLHRSFFQQDGGDPKKFVMHDLINDLAKVVSGKSCLWELLSIKLFEDIFTPIYIRWEDDTLFIDQKDLSDTSIERLPDAVFTLYNLQTLLLSNLQRVGREFYCSNVESTSFQPFPSLEILEFREMLVWDEWISFDGEGDLPSNLPSLTKVSVSNCKRLEAKSTALHWIASIEELEIYKGKQGLLGALDDYS
ncbi:putative disease resistance RPP13-like protein 1 [Prosopis cineraria]|uniref:putative disease resistance RPP13-like protein 1 n=1 Tax=Prosopis cineraria TaxID=364024 RepID=UPI00240ED0D5|nr:putative disease resistance RPP13-like protein 1 [Prosopis cineraria]